MNESRLIELAKQENKNALSMLLSQNYEFVYSYMIKLTLNKETAKDLTQETMVKAIVHLKGFKGNGKFSTWLISIGTNVYKNQVKKSKRMILTDDMSFMDELLPHVNSTETIVEQKERLTLILNCLSKMKDQQRLPFLLKHYYGYSYEEIAQILDVPIGTVRSRIHNTIKKLQKELKGGIYEIM